MRLREWCLWGMMAVGAGCTESGRTLAGSDTDAVGDTGGVDTSPEDTSTDTGVDTSPEDTTVADTTDTSTADTSTDTGGETTTSSLGCAVAEQLFDPFCESCHRADDNYPDLSAGALRHLVNADALAYPGEKLVVPGNLEASLLYRKVHGPGVGEGAPMPPPEEDAASEEGIAALVAWINGGAPPCETVADPGAMTPQLPTPGGDIVFNAAPNGFQATRPAWADEGTCTSQQWWKFQGDTESTSMHPGQDCVGCHSRERGPALSYGGTVYPSLAEASDCRGVNGVKVELINVDDAVFATTTTNAGGNFYFRSNSMPFRPYRVRLSYQGREREMQLIQHLSGDCNTCHDATGSDGALGRVVAP